MYIYGKKIFLFFFFFFQQGHTLICTLEAGAAFGESILYDTPRNATVITSSIVMLLRVEQKDFKILWEVNEKKQRSL